MASCKECRFFESSYDGRGECRRWAPRPMREGLEFEWPKVQAWHWCGQFDVKAPSQDLPKVWLVVIDGEQVIISGDSGSYHVQGPDWDSSLDDLGHERLDELGQIIVRQQKTLANMTASEASRLQDLGIAVRKARKDLG